MDTEKPVCQEILIKQYTLQPKKRDEWMRDERAEKLHGTADGLNSTPRLVSLSTMSFAGSNKLAVTHCRLIKSCHMGLTLGEKRKYGGEECVTRNGAQV